MRVTVACGECFKQGPQDLDGPLGLMPQHLYGVDANDEGVYQMTCHEGHTFRAMSLSFRYEFLFHMATEAIIDKYSREAVLSFTSALERFYEFFVESMCLRVGVEDDVFQSSWKAVSRQSERQLGAFIFAFSMHYKKTPTLLSNKNVSFRNSVIHGDAAVDRASQEVWAGGHERDL